MHKEKSISKKSISVFFFLLVLSVNAQNPFIENKGQFPKQVEAKIKLPSGALFIEEGRLIYAFYSGEELAAIHNLRSTNNKIDAHAYVMDFVGSNTDVLTEFLGESKYHENYFLGDRSSWKTNVKSYKKIIQKNIYKGVEVHYYIEKNKLKYDILFAPKTPTKQVQIKYKGVEDIRLENGNLKTITSVNIITEKKPYAYQIINGNKIDVPCFYKLKKNIVSFDFPEGYNKNFPLIIDPVLEFSTYSGSTADNFGYTATYDNFGYLYAGSTAFGVGYPTSFGAYQMNYANSSGLGTDIAITKYDTTGTERIYSTYLGGSLDELPHSMIVSSANELFIYGTTASSDFPTTFSAFQSNFNGGIGFSSSQIGVSFPNGSDIFVSKISADGGELLSSTFVGGTANDGLNTSTELTYNYADEVRGEIDIDKQNNIYIATCTQSIDFPTKNSFQHNSNGGQEGCIVKMDNQLTSIIWSTYLGGAHDDAIYSLALDDNDNIYVTGGTTSSDFPTTLNAYQQLYQDSINADAFVTKISSNGDQIISSSYFGSNEYDQSYFVEIGSTNDVYLLGQTKSLGTQLVNNAAYSVSGAGQFVSIFNAGLTSVLRSTTVGTGKGTPDISPTSFLVDVCDKIYIAGWGSNLGGPLSTLNLPVSGDAYQSTTDGNDFYLMVLNDVLDTMIYATYFGGSQSNEHVDGGTSRFDKKGIIYQSVCAGCGGNSDFPVEPNPGAVSTTNNSTNCNNAVFKFNFDFPLVLADFNAPWVSCDTAISFQNLTTSSSNTNYTWDFDDGSTSNDPNPTHSFTQNGIYNITLIATDNSACNISDTIIKQVYILSNTSDTIQEVTKCFEQQIQIGLIPVNDPTITYFWVPSTNLSSTNVSNPFCDINVAQQYQLLISNGRCTDTLFQQVHVTELILDAGNDTSYCDSPIFLEATFSNNVTSVQWSSNRNFTDTLSNTSEVIISSPGMFYVKVSDGYCEKLDSLNVLSSINIELFANNICIGDSVLVEAINTTQINPIISYSWSVNNFDTSSFVFSPNSSTWCAVEAINTEQCVTKDSIFIEVYEYPVIDSVWVSDTIIFKGEEIIISVETSESVSWTDFPDLNSIQAFYPEQTKCYQFEVFNSFDCIIKDSICIQVKDVFCDETKLKIPTAFSPNENGGNETYFVQDSEGIVTKFKLEVFNRIGQRVFVSNDIFKEWDGTFRGEKLLPQVFDFYLDLECIGGKKLFHKGNITLIR